MNSQLVVQSGEFAVLPEQVSALVEGPCPDPVGGDNEHLGQVEQERPNLQDMITGIVNLAEETMENNPEIFASKNDSNSSNEALSESVDRVVKIIERTYKDRKTEARRGKRLAGYLNWLYGVEAVDTSGKEEDSLSAEAFRNPQNPVLRIPLDYKK